MGEMKAFVWYNAQGEIFAVGHRADPADDRVTPVARGESDTVIEVTVPEEDVKSLHLTHVVDVKKGELIRTEQNRDNEGGYKAQ